MKITIGPIELIIERTLGGDTVLKLVQDDDSVAVVLSRPEAMTVAKALEEVSKHK